MKYYQRYYDEEEWQKITPEKVSYLLSCQFRDMRRALDELHMSGRILLPYSELKCELNKIHTSVIIAEKEEEK